MPSQHEIATFQVSSFDENRRRFLINKYVGRIVVVSLILLGCGLTLLLSSSAAKLLSFDENPFKVVVSQFYGILYAGALCLMFLGGFRFVERFSAPGATFERRFTKVINFFFWAVILLMVLVIFSAYGQHSYGATRWLDLGFARFQPSELLKVAITLYLARLLTDRSNKRRIAWAWGTIGVSALITLAQPDIGTAALIFVQGLFIMFLASVPFRNMLYGFGVSVALALAFVILLHGRVHYVDDRIYAWWHSGQAADSRTFQINQSMGAVATGGLFGKGLFQGKSAHNRLPLSNKEFIFASGTEEIGVILSTVILLLFLALAYYGFLLWEVVPQPFAALACFALVLQIVTQAAVNMMTTVNLLPTTGVSLPFFSYGRTSLTVTVLEIAAVVFLARHRSKVASERVEVDF